MTCAQHLTQKRQTAPTCTNDGSASGSITRRLSHFDTLAFPPTTVRRRSNPPQSRQLEPSDTLSLDPMDLPDHDHPHTHVRDYHPPRQQTYHGLVLDLFHDVGADTQTAEQATFPNLNLLSDGQPAQSKRTPPRKLTPGIAVSYLLMLREGIAALLRKYNTEGVTKWDEILALLRNESPSIQLKRSTLGAYLKECNLGTSRKNKMADSEMRQLVLEELQESRSQKRGVRKVWKNLKQNGHHIKRDFIEKIMKEVDPRGFSERRPKWRSMPTADPALAPDPARFPLPSAASFPVSSTTGAPEMTNLQASAQAEVQPPALPALSHGTAARQSNVHTLNFEKLPQIETTIDDSSPVSPHQANRFGACEQDDEFEHRHMNNEWNVGGHAAYPSVPGASSHALRFSDHSENPASDRTYSTYPSLEERSSLQEWCAPLDFPDAGEDALEEDVMEEDAGSEHVSTPDDTSEGSASSTGKYISDRMFWEAISIADEKEQRAQITRLQLNNMTQDLLDLLDDQFTQALQGSAEELSTSSDFPTSTIRDLAIDTHIDCENEERQYSPDHKSPEDQVTADALLLALKLQSTLSHTPTSLDIISVAHQLCGLQGRLQDLGMPQKLRNKAALQCLKVLEGLSRTYGPKEWILEKIWRCTADYVHEVGLSWDPQVPVVARKAADAARQLSSRSSTYADFYRASSLHYEAVRVFLSDEENTGEWYDLFTESTNLFLRALPLHAPHEQVQEMMRTMAMYAQNLYRDRGGVMMVLEKVLAYVRARPTDPTLAELFTTIIQGISTNWPSEDENPSVNFESWDTLVTQVVDLMRCFQGERPSRAQPALACALAARASLAKLRGHYRAMVQASEESIVIQQDISRLGDADSLRNLTQLMHTYMEAQLHFTKWTDALSTARRLMELVPSSFSELPHPLSRCLLLFRHRMEITWDPQAPPAVHQLIDAIRGTHHLPHVIVSFTLSIIALSGVQRRLGNFEAALRTSYEALSVAKDMNVSHEMDTDTEIAILACHARSLIDSSAYDEATSYLRRAVSLLRKPLRNERCTLPYYFERWTSGFSSFGLTHAYSHGDAWTSSCISDVPDDSDMLSGYAKSPCWLYTSHTAMCFRDESKDSIAWFLLIQVVTHIGSPKHALKSARKAHTLVSRYYKRVHLEPHVQASILGFKYTLLCILGLDVARHTTLGDTIDLYRSLLTSQAKHHMARLPLLVFLDVLLVLFRNLRISHPEIPRLERWKKAVYTGSTSFFDEFALFLDDLPNLVQVNKPGLDTQ